MYLFQNVKEITKMAFPHFKRKQLRLINFDLCCNPFLGPHKYKKIYIYKKKKYLNSVVLTLFLYPPRALPKSRELNLDSRAQWPTSCSMICSQGALAKERRGEFF